jgi:hypothetical protein
VSFVFGNPRRLLAAALLVLCSAQLWAQNDGLLDLSIDEGSGKVYLSLESFPAEFLYVPGLQSGVGSNDLGLDRGRIDHTRLLRFERYGNRMLLLEPNLKFRAETANLSERRAVNEAFAQSVLAGFPIEQDDNGADRIDLSPLLLSDITRIADLITELEQGTFELDPERTVVDTANIRNFPHNTLIPVVVTLKGSKPGPFISDVTPTPDSLTVRVTHQFVKLPDDGYSPRPFHPRSGYFDLLYRDYAAPLGQPMDKRLIYRHALEPGETLQYYVDNGTPEPIRSALIEGASWWKDAFEAAGFENGFAVDVLPEGIDPLDVRYNVIQWVHRSTRGWSYGMSVADPRTGQILKGHVSLGSLRVRQDQLIAEALTAPFTSAESRPAAAQKMALARLRQLSAHEVGHTLGIDHNFAASSSGDASVMDYPHPNLYLDDNGQVRLDRAYETGISPWDRLAVQYGYKKFVAGEEATGLAAILDQARQQGIAFVNDQDARVAGSSHPGAHLWDNGSDAMQRLDELLAIRQAGLANFSDSVIADGMPLFEMERRLVPVYLLHRYQLEATAKLLGGLYYYPALKGDDAGSLEPVSSEVQLDALKSMIDLLRPERLALPENLRYLVPPPVSGFSRDREFFSGQTGVSFDHLSPARAGADLVISELLQPQRLARLAEQNALDPNLPGTDVVFDSLLGVSTDAPQPRNPYFAAVLAEVQWRVIRGLMALSSNSTAGDVIRGEGTATLISIADDLQSRARKGDRQASALRHEIRKFLDAQASGETFAPEPVPPGSPIG